VVLDPSDSPFAHAPALVTAERLKMIGAAVDLQSMDWSTMVSRRANKNPVGQGGWNLFHTWATAFDVMTPAVAAVLGGAGDKAWFGWPTNEAMEKLRAEWVRQPDAAKRKQIAEQVQQLTYDDVPYVPWGQWVIPGAFRKNVQGVLQFGATLLWNISV
jgi:peptide/nickel transport system substrate-binding protein